MTTRFNLYCCSPAGAHMIAWETGPDARQELERVAGDNLNRPDPADGFWFEVLPDAAEPAHV